MTSGKSSALNRRPSPPTKRSTLSASKPLMKSEAVALKLGKQRISDSARAAFSAMNLKSGSGRK